MAALMLSITLKATVVLLIAAVVAFSLRRASAASRHLVWAVGLGSLLMLSVLSLVLPRWTVSVFTSETEAGFLESMLTEPSEATGLHLLPDSRSSSSPLPVLDEEVPEAPPVSGVSAPLEGVIHSQGQQGSGVGDFLLPGGAEPGEMPWILLIAVMGAALVFGWLVSGQWGVRRLSRRAEPLDDPAWTGLLRDLAWMLDVNRPVRLLYSDLASMPLTWGIFRPVILLPSEASRWPEERRRVVLLHELAHVRRLDCPTQLVAQIACALFWFHPLAWYATHRMRVERERACDDLVLGAGTRPSSYAGHLLEVARAFRSTGLATPAVVSMARPSQLEGRLLAVLDPVRNRRVPGRTAGLTGFFVALGLVVPLAAMHPGARGVAMGEGAEILASGQIRTASPQTASQQPDFRWTGRIAPGETIEVGGIIGDVYAVAATGDMVEVTAVKRRGEHGDPQDVEIRVAEHDEGVSICAVYPTPPDSDQPNSCSPGGDGQRVEDNDTRVDFIVHVPEGVRFIGRTVAGDVRAEDLRSDIEAHTVAGDVTVSTDGYAEASTVGGDIRASLGRTDWSDAVRFRTVGGNITVQLPADASVEIQARSHAGSVSSEFPLTLRENGFVGESASGTLGGGGRSMSLETTGGNIRILRTGGPAMSASAETDADENSTAYGGSSHSVSWSGEDMDWVGPFVESMVDLGVEISEDVSRSVAESISESFAEASFEWDAEWDQEIPEAATDALIEMIGSDPDSEVRRYAAWALADVGREAVPALSKAIREDESAAVREMAAWSLAGIGDPSAIPALHAALDDPEEEVRFTAVWALGEIGGDDAVPALADAIGDQNSEIRTRAAWTIGWIEPAEAPRGLIAALRDPDTEVRAAAAWSLGNIHDVDAIPALGAALGAERSDARERIRWALYNTIQSLSEQELNDVLHSDSPEVRRLAVRAMSGGGPWPMPWPWPMPRPRPTP